MSAGPTFTPVISFLKRFTRLHAVLMALMLIVMGTALGLATRANATRPDAQGATVVTLDSALAVDDDADAWSRYPDAIPLKDRRMVALPDDWANTRVREHTPVWYRLTFSAPTVADGEPPALLIDRACAGALVVVNGHALTPTPSRDGAVSYRCRQPLLMPLAGLPLRPEGNTLDIKVWGHAIQEVGSDDRAAWLSAVQVGGMSTLQGRANKAQLWRVDLPKINTFLFWLMGAMMLVLGSVDRRDSHLTYFGAMLTFVGLLSMRQWLPNLPLDPRDVEMLAVAVLPPTAMTAIQFFLRYAGWRSKPIDVALYAQCAIMPASLLIAGPWRMHTLTSSWLVLLFTEVIVAVGIYLWTMWHRNRHQFFVMLVLCSAGVVFSIMLLMLQQDRTAAVPEPLAQHGLTLVLVMIGLRLAQQFGRQLQMSEASRHSTELRVREATLEIEKNFSQLAELRVEQVTAQERKRIAGDLHDDLGAKLLTIVHTSDNERISSLAREALEEMRLSVRGLTGKPMKLVDALGDWRAEFVQRLSQTGLESDWENPNDEELTQTLSARAYVQTTRILREAVNNIIKHASASRCAVTVTLHQGDFELAIQDNGKGIPMEVDGRLDRGHGMASMKHRAKQLHGQCLFESAPGYGTVIRLTLPLDQHVEPM